LKKRRCGGGGEGEVEVFWEVLEGKEKEKRKRRWEKPGLYREDSTQGNLFVHVRKGCGGVTVGIKMKGWGTFMHVVPGQLCKQIRCLDNNTRSYSMLISSRSGYVGATLKRALNFDCFVLELRHISRLNIGSELGLWGLLASRLLP